MTGNIRLFAVKGWNDFTDAFFSIPERFQDLQTGRLSQGL
jgi:hypothetical protein